MLHDVILNMIVSPQSSTTNVPSSNRSSEFIRWQMLFFSLDEHVFMSLRARALTNLQNAICPCYSQKQRSYLCFTLVVAECEIPVDNF